jgi:hypothetical protein
MARAIHGELSALGFDGRDALHDCCRDKTTVLRLGRLIGNRGICLFDLRGALGKNRARGQVLSREAISDSALPVAIADAVPVAVNFATSHRLSTIDDNVAVALASRACSFGLHPRISLFDRRVPHKPHSVKSSKEAAPGLVAHRRLFLV